jgi:hypothetical protein
VLGATATGALVGTTYVALDGNLERGLYLGTATAAAPLAALTLLCVPAAGFALGGRRIRAVELRRE